ncbi:MAG: MgtC/SapB family protein [Clostridia bacterium]|nr:MgtC/SapB family protein [Clostridia bacterium]
MVFELEALIRILIALACGGIIGYEREYKNRPAGLRTHMLVCIGAALVMIVSQYLFEKYSPGVTDPARLGAQVISGIGFLGAGTIIRDRFSVKGLTTAATLWVVACIGLAIGSGYYLMAIIITGIIFLALILFRKLERVLKVKPSMAKLKITAEYPDNRSVDVKKQIEEMGFIISKTKFIKNKSGNTIDFTFDISCKDSNLWNKLTDRLYENDGIVKADLDF